jgi:hypothetical protein
VETTLPVGSPRVLILVDQPLIGEVIELTLNHGVYATRQAKDIAEATVVLDEWRPHPAKSGLSQVVAQPVAE